MAATEVQFLRFASSIPGSYWGCCACDIIQGFSGDPDSKASIEIISGDGGTPCLGPDSKARFAGPTQRDIFKQRIRFGTFHTGDMPNHGFIAIITRNQINTPSGKKWLQLFKECGFEFLRTIVNSVYTGNGIASSLGDNSQGAAQNYVFGLFRNIGSSGISDPFTPPSEWTDLPKVKDEVWESIADPKALAKNQFAADKQVWNQVGPAKLLTEEEIVKAGAPVILAGRRDATMQEPKSQREQRLKNKPQYTKEQYEAALAVVPAGYVKVETDTQAKVDTVTVKPRPKRTSLR